MTIPMSEVVKRLQDLPSLSAVVTELLASLEDEDLDVLVLGNKIASDQALTAKTLRLANSSFYGVSSKVTTIHQAISVLGFHSIRTLVTACAVSGSFPPTASPHFDFTAFWRHSIACAVASRLLATRLKVNPETAFTVGLLHDIGSLVLFTRFPAEYAQVTALRRQRDCAVSTAETAIFGMDHAAVGSALAAHWKFPQNMQLAVAEHHQAEANGAPSLQLVVHTANTLAHALDLSGQDDDCVPSMSLSVWRALKLSDAEWAQLFTDTEAQCIEMCKILVA